MNKRTRLPHRHRQPIHGRRNNHLAHPGTLPQPKLHAGTPIRIVRIVLQHQFRKLETGKISVSRFPLLVSHGGAYASAN